MEREALKLALEAAEIGLANLTSYQSAPIGPSIHEYGQAARALASVRGAIQALAQPEQENKHIVQSNGRHSSLLTHMMNKRTAPPKREWVDLTVIHTRTPPQPAQEPVACVQDLDEVKRKHLVYEKGMDWKDPLYTAPPKREWVGLTIDEIDVLYGVNCGDGGPTAICEQFVQAIEQALKEKNT